MKIKNPVKKVFLGLFFMFFFCVGFLHNDVRADDLNLDVNLKAPISAEFSSYTIDKKIASADGQDYISITIVEKDINGEPVGEVAPEVKISGTGGYFSQLLYENGVWSTRLYSNFAETKRLSISCSAVFIGEEDILFYQPLILLRVVSISGRTLDNNKSLIGNIHPGENVEILGVGTPRSHIRVYIGPENLSYALDVDVDGNWRILVDQNLVLGDHQIEADALNEYDIMIPRSFIGRFVVAEKRADEQEVVPSTSPNDVTPSTLESSAQPEKKPTLQDALRGKIPMSRYFLSSASIVLWWSMFVILIIVLLTIYVYLKSKKRNKKLKIKNKNDI